MILEMLMMANEDDKADAEKLIQELNTEESPLVDTDTVLNGFETLTMLQEAKSREEMYTRPADEYARAADECGNWEIWLKDAYRKTANDYRQRAGIEHEKVEMCQARVDRYDRIEVNTKGCFVRSSEPRRLANAALDAMPGSFLNGEYQPEMLANYCSWVRNYRVGKVIEFNCYWVRENFSLFDYGTKECLENMTDLYQNGYVSEDDYRAFCYWNEVINHVPSAEADKIRNMMQECIEHAITTVYIYNCLQVIANREITPEECCKVNEIFRYCGITDRNSIACLLICCAGESGGMTKTLEDFVSGCGYDYDERGAGYLQVTGKDDQLACLQYIYDLYGIEDDIDLTKVGYAVELAEYPWEASAWYWAILLKVGINDKESLNSYVMKRLEDNGGKLTLGIVLTAECFVNGVENSTWNTCGDYSIDDALRLIARFDSLRINGGWQVTSEETVDGIVWKLEIPAEILAEITVSTPASDIPSKWDTSTCLEFIAPNNWDTFEGYYNDLQTAGLIDFDLNTDLP